MGAFSAFTPVWACNISKTSLQEIVNLNAQKYQLDPKLISTIILIESSNRPCVRSSEGALGLMQLMPGTAKRFGVKNPFNPQENVEGGSKYLRYLLDIFNGDIYKTLCAYNAGEFLVFKNKTPRNSKLYAQRALKKYRGAGGLRQDSGPNEASH